MLKSKSDTESDKYRNKGNELFEKRQMLQALKCFNAALTYAESKEKQALAYANRSAAYLQAKKYEECLINIQWARENGYPAEKIEKLIEREEKCKKLMEDEVKDPANDPMEFFKLSYAPNPKIPFVADCLESRRINDEARLFTTRDLKPGDLIFKDTMAFTRVNVIAQYFRCCLCSKTNMMNLIPCERTASLMFCSTECRKKTYELYGNCLGDMLVEDEVLEVNERFWKEAQEAFGGKENLIKFMDENDVSKMKKTIFDFDWREDPEKTRIICCLSLDTKTSPVFFDQAPVTNAFDDRPVLKRFLNKIAKINGTFYQGIISKIEGLNVELEGSGFIMFQANVRISCMPNVESIDINNETYGYVTRPIKAGEEIFMPKSFHAFDFDADEERSKGILGFAVKCHSQCYGCTNNITRDDFKNTLGVLSFFDAERFVQKSFGVFNKSKNMVKVSEVKKVIKENWDICDRYGDDPVSREAVTARERNNVMLYDLVKAILFPVSR